MEGHSEEIYRLWMSRRGSCAFISAFPPTRAPDPTAKRDGDVRAMKCRSESERELRSVDDEVAEFDVLTANFFDNVETYRLDHIV